MLLLVDAAAGASVAAHARLAVGKDHRPVPLPGALSPSTLVVRLADGPEHHVPAFRTCAELVLPMAMAMTLSHKHKDVF